MDEQIDDYVEPHPEDQAVEAAEAEDAATPVRKRAPKKVRSIPDPEPASKTSIARMNALAKLANAGR